MSWRHLEDKTVKARKRHSCYLCGESIEVGEGYIRRTGADDEEIDSIAMHPECEEATRDWLWWEWEEIFEGDMPRPRKGG